MPSSTKENVRSATATSTKRSAMSDGDVFGSAARSEMMLSPPPEEELRYTRRPTNEPSSASKPLASSMRSNEQSPVAFQKRKRTITGASPRHSPGALQNQQEGASPSVMQHTPNPRVRKQVRHAGASPSPAHTIRADALRGSPSAGDGPSREHAHEDALMTPTRKGKRRGRSMELVAQSPHAANPSADYIPPSHLVVSPRGVSVRRRSVTPIPPYEPPKERYTPPREIIVSPPAAAERKPARRAVGKKKRVSVKSEKPVPQLRIKTEPPEVDLTTPAPPASPSEDPILLVGPPVVRVQRPSLPPSDSREPVSLVDFEMDLDLPENSERAASRLSQRAHTSPLRSDSSIPPAFDFSNINDDDAGGTNNGWTDSSSDTDFGSVVDNGVFANVNDDGWSDSDSDNGNGEEGASIGEGDFTGKFLAYKAPLKLDPPSGEARDRMEEWARPISPHPKRLSIAEPKEEDVDVDLDAANDETAEKDVNETHENDQSAANGDDSESEIEGQEGRRPGYEDRRGRRLTLTEVEAIKFGPRSSTSRPGSADNVRDGHALKGQEMSAEDDESLEPNEDSFEQEDNVLGQDESMQADIDQRNSLLEKDNILDNDSEQHFNLTQTLDDSYRQEVDDPDRLSGLHTHPYYSQNTSAEEEGNDAFSARFASEHSSGESSQSTLNNPDVAGSKYHDHIDVEEVRAITLDSVQSHLERTSQPEAKLLKHGKDAMQEESLKRGASLLRAASPPNGNLSDCETEIVTEEEPEDGSDDGASDLSVVKIMSDDPMAAARAAAILKMHDYDMVARKLRRRRTTAGGVSKAYSTPQNMQLWRRRTVAGLTAEDDLPANIALPQLLEKAEEELRSSPARSRSGSLALSSVGSPQRPRYHDFMYEDANVSGIREWTKADWKLLDSCFTDERYDLGEQQGLESGCLADVDDVPLESVIERFIELMGGAAKVEGHGPSWSLEKLMSRAKALCKRQRSGNGAPPTPDVSARFSTPSRFSTLSPSSSMIVPDFTPSAVERTRLFESGSVSRKARLPPPSSESFFRVPSTMPARHSRLRDDVTSTVLETPKSGRALGLFGFATPTRNEQEEDSDDESVALEVETMLTPITASRMRLSRPESAVKRSLSYISSWLKPDTYKSKSDGRKGSQLPGLPVPPSDLLSKPRGPVETPAPKPASKAVPPKDLVALEHIPPPKPSKLPRSSKPRRLVDLQHVPTPQPKEEVKKAIPRRSSSSSVRDLVKEFEQKEKVKVQVLPPRVAELRKQASVGSLKSRGKPSWRP